MKYLTIIIICLFVQISYLIIEQKKLKKIRKKIPLRICVTGTRGKSSVVRLLAAILRESGLRVLAKVTGSKPVIILPDGREEEIKRMGRANILEQVKILRQAGKMNVDAVVLEIMSISPENHYVESCQIIDSNIVAITNIRLDHTGKMGTNRDEIAATIGLTIPRSGTVFVNEADYLDFFTKLAHDKQTMALAVPKLNPDGFGISQQLKQDEFIENIELALAVANHLGIEQGLSLKALLKTTSDFGALKAWKFKDKTNLDNLLLISAFAANDPDSTRKVFAKCQEEFKYEQDKVIGLLNLRADRPERTFQWCNTFLSSPEFNMKKLLLIGDKSACFYMKRKLRNKKSLEVTMVNSNKPEIIMDAVFNAGDEHSVIIGFGNIKGSGEKLVNYWDFYGRKIL